MESDRTQVAVVVRYTQYEGVPPEDCIALMSSFPNVDVADAEAKRLNEVRRNERVSYFVKLIAKTPSGFLSEALGLDESDQDWGIINADESRLEEFLEFGLSARVSKQESYDLVELVIASANDRLERVPDADISGIWAVLDRFPEATDLRLEYWSRLDNSEFPIGQWLRDREGEER